VTRLNEAESQYTPRRGESLRRRPMTKTRIEKGGEREGKIP